MSRQRLVIALMIAAGLAVLMGWQLHREQLVKACLDGGGTWHGARSECGPPSVRPILQRDLRRS
jgi:hypothetical protein